MKTPFQQSNSHYQWGSLCCVRSTIGTYLPCLFLSFPSMTLTLKWRERWINWCKQIEWAGWVHCGGKTKLSQARAKSHRHRHRSKISASLVAGTGQGSFFRWDHVLKFSVSSTNTAAPAKCVSFHAEMVPRPFCIAYKCIAHRWVIPRGHQAREQYPETDSFELGLPPSDSDSISLMPLIYNRRLWAFSWFTRGTSNRKGLIWCCCTLSD